MKTPKVTKPVKAFFDKISEDEAKNRGILIADMMGLKHPKGHPDRYHTAWGTKTALGVFLSVKRLVVDGE